MPTSEKKLTEFFTQFPTKSYQKNELLLPAYAKVHSFYFLETGAVKMSKTTVSGKKIVLHIFFPGSFFPLLAIEEHDVNPYDFSAILPTTVRVVPRNELLSFLKSDVKVLWDLQQRLLKGLAGLLTRIEQVSLTPAISQVAGLLVYFSKHFTSESSESTKIEVTITHQEIADWLGLSRENVSIQMKKLETDGVIEIKEHAILICDKTKLIDLSQAGLA